MIISRYRQVQLKTILSTLFLGTLGVALVVVISVFLYQKDPDVSAASMSNFDAGNIMSDAVMSNKNTMTQGQIQNFLSSKNRCKTSPKNPSVLDHINAAGTHGTYSWNGTTYKYNLKDGKFICLADQDFNGESAARIIYRASQDYSINPQVLIVLLEKEAGLLSDNWPNYNIQYATATGYACPDSGPNHSANCDASYYGFKNQVRQAASMFNTLLQGQGINNYPIGDNFIQYNPQPSCGGSIVNVKNRATGALYTYTPYQPNKATREAPLGDTASCGAYGNKNFYLYFTDWFGPTKYTIRGSIKAYYDNINGDKVLGWPLYNERSNGKGANYQCFQRGCIIGSATTGYWESKGSIRKHWTTLSREHGVLGLPTGPEVKLSAGGYQQSYEGGVIAGRSSTGYWEVYSKIEERRDQLGKAFEYPAAGVKCGIKNDGCYQNYEHGAILWSESTGAWESKGSIRKHWTTLSREHGVLGLPTGPEVKLSAGGYQQSYEGGVIHSLNGKMWHSIN